MNKISVFQNEKEKIIKLNDNLLEIGVRKGLIERVEDNYVFVGDYEELLAFKNKKILKRF
jgi:hypothetical protein